MTKCALEHVRVASSLEQIAAGAWKDAIEEAIEAAVHDITLRGAPGQFRALRPDVEEVVPNEQQMNPAPPTPGFLPAVAPVERLLRLLVMIGRPWVLENCSMLKFAFCSWFNLAFEEGD